MTGTEYEMIRVAVARGVVMAGYGATEVDAVMAPVDRLRDAALKETEESECESAAATRAALAEYGWSTPGVDLPDLVHGLGLERRAADERVDFYRGENERLYVDIRLRNADNAMWRERVAALTAELALAQKKVDLLMQPIPEVDGDFPWQMMRLWAVARDEEKHAAREEIGARDARIVDLERRLGAVLAALPRCIAVWDLQTNARSCAKRATRGPHDVVDGDVCGDFYCDEHAGDYTDELPWADFVREAGR